MIVITIGFNIGVNIFTSNSREKHSNLYSKKDIFNQKKRYFTIQVVKLISYLSFLEIAASLKVNLIKMNLA
jgi:hypothetical protein